MKKPGAVTSKPTVNPASRFTSKPFPEEKQAWPALQREMKPVPDCGEESYRGSGKLTAARRW